MLGTSANKPLIRQLRGFVPLSVSCHSNSVMLRTGGLQPFQRRPLLVGSACVVVALLGPDIDGYSKDLVFATPMPL